jgi:hypothetical protein
MEDGEKEEGGMEEGTQEAWMSERQTFAHKNEPTGTVIK